MGYDMFSQLQGPNISISLFGDASKDGARLGQAIPTQLTSAIRGAQEGYQYALETTAVRQQNTIRDNQIEQIPVENEIRQEQLRALENQNTIGDLSAKLAVNTETLKQEQVISELKAKTAESNQILTNLDVRKKIDGILDSATSPEEKLKVLESPEFSNAAINDPKWAEGKVGKLYGVMSDQQRNNAQAMLDFSKQHAYDSQKQTGYKSQLQYLAEQKNKAFIDAQKDGNLAPLLSQIGPNLSSVEVRAWEKANMKDGKVVLKEDGTPDIERDTTGEKFQVYVGGKLVSDRILDKHSRDKMQFLATTSKAEDTLYRSDLNLRPKVDSPSNGESTISTLGEEKPNTAPIETNPGATREERLAQKQAAVRARMQNQKKLQEDSISNQVQTPAGQSSSNALAEQPSTAQSRVNATTGKFQNASYTPAKAVGLPEDIAPLFNGYKLIVPAVAKVEYNPRKHVSWAGARGPMQVMPGTFNDVVKRYKLKDKNIDNPADNIEVGSLYLAEQIKTFGSEPGNGLELALAAYNSGPGHIADALREAIGNGNPTWEGVKKELKRNLNPKAYDEVSVYPDKVLRELAKALAAEGTPDQFNSKDTNPDEPGGNRILQDKGFNVSPPSTIDNSIIDQPSAGTFVTT